MILISAHPCYLWNPCSNPNFSFNRRHIEAPRNHQAPSVLSPPPCHKSQGSGAFRMWGGGVIGEWLPVLMIFPALNRYCIKVGSKFQAPKWNVLTSCQNKKDRADLKNHRGHRVHKGAKWLFSIFNWNRTQMTRIWRISTDVFNQCASVLSVESVL